jgi:hypothetical protein
MKKLNSLHIISEIITRFIVTRNSFKYYIYGWDIQIRGFHAVSESKNSFLIPNIFENLDFGDAANVRLCGQAIRFVN